MLPVVSCYNSVMANLPMGLQPSDRRAAEALGQQSGFAGDDGTVQVEAVVLALIPAYHQVKVRDAAGHLYTLTHKTLGVDLASLREGQHVLCTVTRRLPRVLIAAVVA